jgi:hypothetical protein
VCPFCVKTQTLQTDFFDSLNHIETTCLKDSHLKTSE